MADILNPYVFFKKKINNLLHEVHRQTVVEKRPPYLNMRGMRKREKEIEEKERKKRICTGLMSNTGRYVYLSSKQKALGLPLRNSNILKMDESGGPHASLNLLHSYRMWSLVLMRPDLH